MGRYLCSPKYYYRLAIESSNNRRNALLQQARTEMKLVQTYMPDLPSQEHALYTSEIDGEAVKILSQILVILIFAPRLMEKTLLSVQQQ